MKIKYMFLKSKKQNGKKTLYFANLNTTVAKFNKHNPLI